MMAICYPPPPPPPLLGDLLTTPVADSQSFCFVLLVRRLNDVIFNIYYYPCLVYNFVLRFVLRGRVRVHGEHTYVWLCRYTFPGILSHYNDWLLQCTYMYMYLHRLQFVYIPPPPHPSFSLLCLTFFLLSSCLLSHHRQRTMQIS